MAGGGPMSPLDAALGEGPRLRRALGHDLDDAGRQLAKFVVHMEGIGAETITMEAVWGSCSTPASIRPAPSRLDG